MSIPLFLPLIASLLSIPSHVESLSPPAADDSIPQHELAELVVTGNSARQRLDRIALGAETLELSQLNRLPSFLGENDVIKSLTLLPGVRSEGDGGGGFEVRGGNSSQNRILLDGMTIYNPAHVMGIFSTFNDATTAKATLYKGNIPARYGAASSSVLETTLLPGDMEHWEGAASIGLLIAKGAVSGPVVKDKLSIAIGARRSYADLFIAMIPQYRGTVMNFYDITAKLRFIPRHDDILDASFIIGHDNMAVKDVMGMYWGNTAASVRWLASRGDNHHITVEGTFTSYSPKMARTFTGDDMMLHQYIRQASLRVADDIHFCGNNILCFGYQGDFLRVKSMDMDTPGGRQVEIRSGIVNAIYATWEGSFKDKFSMEAGARLDLYSSLSGDRFTKFHSMNDYAAPDFSQCDRLSAEPRISLKYDLSPYHNIKAGYSRTSQYLHSLRSSSTSFPFDRYTLSSALIKPESCSQWGIGYVGMTPAGSFDWSVEGYWKSLTGVYDYADGMTMFSQVNMESLILAGKGRSYGLELMVRKNTGALTGWISYTLSHTQSKIPGINDGKWYNATNDRRHDFTIAGIYRLNDKWSLSANWIYSSGHPLTAPDLKYDLSGATIYYYSRRNGYKTPSTHRLDISATRTCRNRHFTSEWNFGLYNVYCRYNPYLIYFEDDPDSPSGTVAVLRALFGVLPSVSYTIRF